MSGFFGFNTALPERQQTSHPQHQGFGGFGGNGGGNDQTAFSLGGAGEEEDLAVYNWGDQTGSLMDDGDGVNDVTFGDVGDIHNDFQFSSHQAPVSKPKAPAARGQVASTQSRYKPKVAHDPFAFSEDDFYSPRRPASKPTKAPAPVALARNAPAPRAQPAVTQGGPSMESLWGNPAPPASTMWGASPASSTRPSGPAAQKAPATITQPPPIGQMKTLAEIEEEMSRMAIPEPPQQHQMLSMDEIERQMMQSMESGSAATAPTPVDRMIQPPRQATPPQINLAGSGYASQQALLDSMFPELGTAPPPGTTTASFPTGDNQPPRQSPEEQARLHALHERIKAKIENMSRYNHLMGNSDKDFITRIQLSQLVTADPYASDFYAQVFSALRRRQEALTQPDKEGEGPTVVQITEGASFAVSAPANRFGKMGQATMSRLSGQVKKLVEGRLNHQKASNTAALKGALGKVSRAGVAAPRPVLAVPSASSNNTQRTTSMLNDQSGIRRSALTKKQVLFALEGLYDSVLELEQMRREMPPPTAMEEIDGWNQKCGMKVEEIWRRLMVMEPLDVSNPHPFISLMNPVKGQRLFPRLLRHLPHQQALTLLTLIIATYPQLDVVARAPPPPVTDASLLTKADRLDRAKREAETDSFLHCVVPGLDILLQRCGLGMIAGLLGIIAQRMEVWRVASTRPGVALFTALLSRAQSLIRPDPSNPAAPPAPDAAEVDQWNKTYAYFLSILLPHLSDLFPSSLVQRNAFGPGGYLMTNNDGSDEMERRDAEVWGFTAALAVNAPEEEQANLVGALREKILHTVQSSRGAGISVEGRERKLRNVNMFLHGLGLDASMIE